MTARWGCISGTGLVAGLITPLAVAFAAIFTGGDIFSPGALRAVSGSLPLGGAWSHADLTCGECHTPFWGDSRMTDRCLSCHAEIQAEISSRHTLHGALSSATECRQCHSEHHGPLASLTDIRSELFPHGDFGFSLLTHGKHGDGAPFRCQDCHVDSLRTFSANDCGVCHLQLDQAFMIDHAMAYGLECLACHDGIDTYGKAFDHQTASFPLAGAHVELPCLSCHLGATTAQALQSSPQSCIDCHRDDDVHEGRLGGDCAACHSSQNWNVAAFDHGLTHFPLAGSHASVECQDCHVDGQMAGIPIDCPAAISRMMSTTAAWGRTALTVTGPLPGTISSMRTSIMH